ncbi:MAG: MFS transporter [Clostridia bacterium]|nr:MFS transporter [Clostridia bacterium]
MADRQPAGRKEAGVPLWRHRPFVIFLTGYALSAVGDSFFELALAWYVYVQSGSSLQVAGVGVAFQLAYTLIGPIAGVYADRWDRRRTLIACDVLRGALVAAVAVLTWREGLPYWAAIATVFLLETTGQFFNVSQKAFIPLIVAREGLVGANGAISAARQSAGIGGHTVGGLVVSAWGAVAGLVADAVSFWVSALSIWLIRVPPASSDASQGDPGDRRRAGDGPRAGAWARFWSELREGWAAIATVPLVRTLVFFAVFLNAVFAMIEPVFPAYVTHQLHLGAWAFGVVQSTLLVGSVAGGLLAGWLGRAVATGRLVIASVLGFGLAVVAIGLTGSFVLAALLWAVAGVGLAVTGAVVQAVDQILIPQAVMARAFGLISAAGMALMPLGTLVGGYLATVMAPGSVYALVGLAMVLMGLVLAGNAVVRGADARVQAGGGVEAL